MSDPSPRDLGPSLHVVITRRDKLDGYWFIRMEPDTGLAVCGPDLPDAMAWFARTLDSEGYFDRFAQPAQ